MVSTCFTRLVAFLVALGTVFAFPGMQVPNDALLKRHPQGDGSAGSSEGVDPPPPPGPPAYTGIKLVNDADHSWEPLRPGDERGPCPALNTLASHGVRCFHDSRFLRANSTDAN